MGNRSSRRMRRAALLLPAAAILLPAAAGAQTAERPPPEGFDLGGSARLRYEAIGDQPRAGIARADELVSLRTQLRLTYRSGRLWTVAEVYDSRAWGGNGGTPRTTGDVNALEPVQAYLGADLGPVLGKGTNVTLEAGRFMLNLGSRRLVASDDYRNTTNSYTGLLVDVAAPGGVKGTALFVLPQARLPDDASSLRANAAALDRESFDAMLWGGLVSVPLMTRRSGPPVRAEFAFLHFGERDGPGRPTRDRSLDNASLRIFSDPAPRRFDFGVEAIYQWGEASLVAAQGTARLPVSASYVRGQVGYSFGGHWKPRVMLSLDRASGDAPGGRYNRFDFLFGMRRAELAPSGLYNAVGRTNLFSPELRVEVAPGRRLDAFLAWRPMWLADRSDAFATTGVRDSSGRSGNFAGHQFDFRLRYWLAPQHLRLELDGTLLAKGRFLRDAPNAPPGPTARYGSLNLTASF